MKNLILIFCFVIFCLDAQANAPKFLELNSYGNPIVGGRLALIASVRTTPTDPEVEIYITSKFDGENLKVTRFGETEYAGVIASPALTGSFVWEVKAYLQNRVLARDVQAAVIRIEKEIFALNERYEQETESDKKAAIVVAVSEYETQKSELLARIESHRVLVETKTLDVNIGDPPEMRRASEPIKVHIDTPTGDVTFGDKVDIFVDVFPDTSERTKNRVEAWLGGERIYFDKVTDSSFKTTVNSAALALGPQVLSVSFYYANYHHAESILNAYLVSSQRIAELIRFRDSALDPAIVDYYQRELNDVNLIRSAFQNISDNMPVLGGTEITLVNVVDRPDEFMTVAAGYDTACGIYRSAVYCWGANANGELGNASASLSTNTPTTPALLNGVTDIKTGSSHNCAILRGELWCWGANSWGQLGTGDQYGRNIPVQVSVAGRFEKLSVGAAHTCAISKGTVYCWGNNQFGQLGVGSTEQYIVVPAELPLSDVIDVAAGDFFTCAVVKNGSVYCWGRNTKGELGNGGYETSYAPRKVAGISDASDVEAGNQSACALMFDQLKCWGSAESGQLGSTITSGNSPTPVTIDIDPVVSVALGGGSLCAITNLGSAKCWGSAQGGTLGNGQTTGFVVVPVQVVGLTSGVTSLSVAPGYACAVQNGVSKCWGTNVEGSLGDGSTIGGTASTPVVVVTPGTFK
ncbi:RCC1 domain-containing protein [Bdellovibrio bacteriovorus]|uniref:RCC1-like domain-containing protein n=1 Tax=Bdellovibrio bacteriovorus str. Tiberius TaxID=1069642 RepID=K7YSM5_BDEBC|nr:hypothetical protein [Bdellovibrio bacteriovorus]AFY02886.1 hypothetical protein Bdt_3211 [Bdellovibrio bacteriovorus str. Tiberius]